LLFALLLLLSQHVSAQTPSPSPSPSPKVSSSPSLEREFFKNILRDQKAIWTAPFKVRGSDARWLTPLGLGTAALIATDKDTAAAVAKSDRQLPVSRAVSYAGSTYGAAGIAATFYFVGRARKDARARETGLLAIEALIDSEIVVVSMKAITGRRRPLEQDRGEFFKGGRSFPSGHSMHAWAVATVIAHEYHDRRLVQIGAYGLATAVSISRFTGKNHFLSDVLVGSAIGYGIGRYVYRARHRQSPGAGGEQSRAPIRWWPLVSPTYDRQAQEYGLALVWSF